MMRRGYTVEEYTAIIQQLRTLRPAISVSSDFIVGFPGETLEDFQATLNIIEELKFDTSFSFMYSPRPQTQAAKLKDDIPLEEKKRRLAILQQALKVHADHISNTMLDTPQNILVTNISKKKATELSGRTENNRIVNFKADSSMIGNIAKVKITAILPNCLHGEIIIQ